DRAFVENDLELEAEIADRTQDRRLVRLHGRYDDMADGKGLDLFLLERADEFIRRRIAVRLLLAGRWIVYEGAVLGDDARAKFRFGENTQQIVELAAAHQHQLAAGGGQALERGDGFGRDVPAARQRLVEIAGQNEISHDRTPPL